MTSKKYPKFNSPTLVEALCEVRYNALPDGMIKRIPSSLVGLLSEEYPLFDVIDESPVKFSIGENIVSENIHRYKFSSENHNYIITVKKDSFSFTLKQNKDNPYDQDKFYDKLCFEWEKIADALKIEDINRIGVRFINFLKVNAIEKNIVYFQGGSPYLTQASLETNKRFICRNEISIDDNNRFIVTSASQNDKSSKDKKDLILDIDRIFEQQNMPNRMVREMVKTLHGDIEDIFFSSITDDYKQLMQPIKE